MTTVLLQLSLITPFVMLLIAALVTCGILRGKPHWPVVTGVALTALVAVTCLCFFSSRLEQQTYSLTLLNWLSLAGESTPQLQIGVLFDPVSLGFYGLISLGSLFFLLLIPKSAGRLDSQSRYSWPLYLLGFCAATGIVLSTNFLELFFFWIILSLSLNLLHEVNLQVKSAAGTESRHWWGWNAFSDAMLLLALFLIHTNFSSLDFVKTLQPAAIQAVHAQNRVALPGIGVILFLAAVPRLGLFPASALVISNSRPWTGRSLAALNLLAMPVGLFLLVRGAPLLLTMEATQNLVVQLAMISAVLTGFSAFSLMRGPHWDRCLSWLAATLTGIIVATLGMSGLEFPTALLPIIVVQTCVISVLISLVCWQRQQTIPQDILPAIRVCLLLLLTAALIDLGAILNPLIEARSIATESRNQVLIWLMLPLVSVYVFGLARFYFTLSRQNTTKSNEHFPILLLWGITGLICLLTMAMLFPLPYVPRFWQSPLMSVGPNPFDRDWLFCSFYFLSMLVALILAWMTAPKTTGTTSERVSSSLLQLGESHYHASDILNRTIIQPMKFLVKCVTFLDDWLAEVLSRSILERLPGLWGHLLSHMQNGQTAFPTLVLIFTMSILIFVLMVLQI
ncbi:hypothetical protein [Gimesia algae]|uniref:NADH dehydrogenase subunit M n=1 Tax=Gimesia algae TaxID=2527971 RepID=A0A517VDR5_9PLAN|nr:hypothetical protein [Gimesia algae]QDT91146.1 NADH dehydrogenase subunit M [Gimesia algae]